MSNIVYVESLDPTGAYPVAGTYRNYTSVGTGFVQHAILTDASSDVQVRVFSYAVANPLAVGLVDKTGTHIEVFSVLATQGNPPWTVVASCVGQQTVTASIVGTIAASMTGTVVASVIGQPTVTASLIGTPTIVGSVRVGPPNTAIATTLIIVTASGTAIPTTALTNRMRIVITNTGLQTVYIGPTGVGSGGTTPGFPLKTNGTLTLEVGPSIALFGATVGSDAAFVNSGQQVRILELS